MEYFTTMSEGEFASRFPDLHLEVCDELGMGFVPNLFRCLANINPELALTSWVMVKNSLCNGELPRVSKEILLSYIAFRRNCEYCHIAHRAMALKFGHSEQDILEIIEDIDSVRNPLLRNILKFGELCLNPDFNAKTQTYHELENLGLEKAEISELIGMVSCSLYLINLADSLVVDIDKRFTDCTNR
ncbi:MAG: carboxymuconolactone decarboxylase family protein [Oceanospirillaceae bacterium]